MIGYLRSLADTCLQAANHCALFGVWMIQQNTTKERCSYWWKLPSQHAVCFLHNMPHRRPYCVPGLHNMLPDSIACTLRRVVTYVISLVVPRLHNMLPLKKCFALLAHAREPLYWVLVSVDEGTKYTVWVYFDLFYEQVFTAIDFHDKGFIWNYHLGIVVHSGSSWSL